MSDMLVVGSVARDTLHFTRGSHPYVLGGSAVFASLAGACFVKPRLVGVVGTDWGPHFKRLVDGHVAGDFPGANYWLGMEDDVVYVKDWNSDIPADMVAQIEAKLAMIADGSFTVFQGPLMDQSGTERVADGVAMTDGEILGMDWHVAGVTTPLPS